MTPAPGTPAPPRAAGRVSRSRDKSRPNHPEECCCGSRCAWGKVPGGRDAQVSPLELKTCSCWRASFRLFAFANGLFGRGGLFWC